MQGWTAYLLTALAIFVFLVLPTWIRVTLQERRARKARAEAIDAGRHEPPSIRPYVDPARCMGSGACVAACPEKDVIAVIGRRAEIVHGAHCVGHGACAVACPTQAITLVFGSAKRGIDLPEVSLDFQSNVRGLYIAGELGGMGLIANAVDQGCQAARAALDGLARDGGGLVDLAIVGAGPAGLAAALVAKQSGRSYVLLEQDSFGGAIRHYPRQKLVMTRSMDLPGYGKVHLRTARKEELVALFEKVVAQTRLEVSEQERVDAVEPQPDGTFVVRTSKREVRARRVILAIGRRGTPRRLEVPGEDVEKVAYRLLDPELYQHQHILVVGGGDSALEAACALADQPGNRVTLSYRREALNRPKGANLDRLREAQEAGGLEVLLGSTVAAVEVDRVHLDSSDGPLELPNDFVFVFAGGILPTAFLERAGIRIATHHGLRVVERAPAPTG